VFAAAVGPALLATAPAPLLELDSRHDDLDRLRKTAADASDSSEEAKSKYDEFEECRRGHPEKLSHSHPYTNRRGVLQKGFSIFRFPIFSEKPTFSTATPVLDSYLESAPCH